MKVFKVDRDAMDVIEAKMEGLKTDIEGLREGLTKLLQERLLSGDNVSHKNKDEDKRNMNYDFRDSNNGLKTNYIPNINMTKFDDKDQVTWILQMEHFFDLHDVQHTQKVCIASLYLEPNQFVWY